MQITLTGQNAIAYAEANNLLLSKYADPIEDARENLTIEQAKDVVREDSQLIWIEAAEGRFEIRVIDDWDDRSPVLGSLLSVANDEETAESSAAQLALREYWGVAIVDRQAGTVDCGEGEDGKLIFPIDAVHIG